MRLCQGATVASMSQCWPKVTDAAHCSATSGAQGLQTGRDGTKVPAAIGSGARMAVGEGCRGGLLLPDLSGNQRGVQARRRPGTSD
jgi:hypothetical protein